MYYEMYNALKGAIAGVEGVTGVEWFTNQYEGAAPADGRIYVEGMALVPAAGSKEGGRMTVQIRLHVSSSAGESREAMLAANDALADRVLSAVEGLPLPYGGGMTRGLELSSWSYLPKVADGMVTLVELRAKA